MTILDNYLSRSDFHYIKKEILRNEGLPWHHSVGIADLKSNSEESYFTHSIWQNLQPVSPLWDVVKYFIVQLPDFKGMLRAKVNLYPKQHEIVEHPTHTDMDFPHKGAILYLNTCDGFTRLDENTTVESVENRLLLFDSSKPHNSTSTTTPPGRFNININYL